MGGQKGSLEQETGQGLLVGHSLMKVSALDPELQNHTCGAQDLLFRRGTQVGCTSYGSHADCFSGHRASPHLHLPHNGHHYPTPPFFFIDFTTSKEFLMGERAYKWGCLRTRK